MPAPAGASSSTKVPRSEVIHKYGAELQPPNLLFEDTPVVADVDHSRFDKVARVTCESQENSTKIEVDIYTEIWPVESGEQLHIIMLKSLSLTQSLTTAFDHDQRVLGKSIADAFGYVTYGTCYQRDEQKDGRTIVHVSFGGLLMRVTGEQSILKDIHLDDRVYCLMRKDVVD